MKLFVAIDRVLGNFFYDRECAFPLTIVPKLRTALAHMDRFEDPYSNLEPVHMR